MQYNSQNALHYIIKKWMFLPYDSYHGISVSKPFIKIKQE